VDTFRFVAVNPQGKRVRGAVKGFSPAAVTADLLDQGLESVRVRRRRALRDIEVTTRKIKPVALMHLSRQMATFVRAGVPILEALDIVQEDVADKALRTVLPGVADALRRGDTFAEAMENYAEVFPPFYLGVLRSAEVTGRLDEVLDRLAVYLERDEEARRQIRSALAYPGVIMVMTIVTVVVLTGFVLPRFKDFFKEFHARLPLATRMLISVTDFVTHWGLAIVGVVAGLLTGLVVGLRTRRGKRARDSVLLRLPVVRDVVRHAVIERFCRLLASLVHAGIPLPDAMAISARGAHNLVYEAGLADVTAAMLRGEGLAEPLRRTELFPSSAVQMIRVGEQTGTLETQLDVTARFFDQELGYKLKRLTTYFEPAAILFMGVIVGFVAIALVSAIYGIYHQVNLK
jgi:type IV pilus assembly protein PilC